MDVQKLILKIENKQIKAAELEVHRRLVVVDELRQRGKTQDEIADLFECSRRTVERYCVRIRTIRKSEIDFLPAREAAAILMEDAKILMNKAIRAGDYRAAWVIRIGLMDKLESYGLIIKAEPPREGQVKTDLTLSELVRRGYKMLNPKKLLEQGPNGSANGTTQPDTPE